MYEINATQFVKRNNTLPFGIYASSTRVILLFRQHSFVTNKTITNHKQKVNQHLSVKVNYIVEEISLDFQCGFRPKRSTTGLVFCIRQTPKKNGNTIG